MAGARSYAQSAKISPRAAAALANGNARRLLLVMSEQADLSAAAQLSSKAEKTRYVYETLRAEAARTQPTVASAVSNMGLTPSASLYIVNAIALTAPSGQPIDTQTATALAARTDIGSIKTDDELSIDPIERVASSEHVVGIAWNVAWVKAPQVWKAGFTGQGIVMGSIDSGVEWNHPALIRQYRGWNGATADHKLQLVGRRTIRWQPAQSLSY